MGIRASATCTMQLRGRAGELIGEPHRGMRDDVHDDERGAPRRRHPGPGAGRGGVPVRPCAYARERLQGRALGRRRRAPTWRPTRSSCTPTCGARCCASARRSRAAARWRCGWRPSSTADRIPTGDAAGGDDLVALMTPIVKAALTDLGVRGDQPRAAACSAAPATSARRASSSSCATRASRRSTRARTASRRSTSSAASCRRAPGACCGASSTRRASCWTRRCADERLADIAGPARDALDRLRRTTLWLADRAQADREEAGAGATEYLRLFYLTALGVLWVRMARAALTRDDEFGGRQARHGALLRGPDAARDLGAGPAGDGRQGDADGAARAPVLSIAGDDDSPTSSPARDPADTAPVRVLRSLRLPLDLRARLCADRGGRAGARRRSRRRHRGLARGGPDARDAAVQRAARLAGAARHRRGGGARDRLGRRASRRSASPASPRRT